MTHARLAGCALRGLGAALAAQALAASLIPVPVPTQAAEEEARAPVAPFEAAHWSTPANAVDAAVGAGLRRYKLEPAAPCSDEVFVRRVYLDMIGTLPEPSEVTAFLQDARENKRAELIEALFRRKEFADYWALKWCDLLRVKSEFPANLWPNAGQACHRWIRQAVRDNLPMGLSGPGAAHLERQQLPRARGQLLPGDT